MSKNYEVLRQADRAKEVFKSSPALTGGNVHLNGNFRAHEEILNLIHRTYLSNMAESPRLVVFSAVEHGSGCSWVCAHVAESLASHVDGAVCLVDADVHSPSLYRYFGLNDGHGLADAMLQSGPIRNFTQQVRGGNLHLISGRRLPSDLSSVMSPERLRARFSELCSEFAYVVVDAPPVGSSADALMLSQISGGVVLVVEANSTRREAARRVKESLESANVRVLGAVLNKRSFPIPKGLYNKF